MALGRNRQIVVARQEPRLIEAVAARRSMATPMHQSPSLVPGPSESNVQVIEIEETLRKFAQRLQQRRSRPRSVFIRVGGWVRS